MRLGLIVQKEEKYTFTRVTHLWASKNWRLTCSADIRGFPEKWSTITQITKEPQEHSRPAMFHVKKNVLVKNKYVLSFSVFSRYILYFFFFTFHSLVNRKTVLYKISCLLVFFIYNIHPNCIPLFQSFNLVFPLRLNSKCPLLTFEFCLVI